MQKCSLVDSLHRNEPFHIKQYHIPKTNMDLLILFTTAFLAATILPAQSEIVLVGLHLTGNHSIWLLVLIATCGNVLGSCINWLLGRYIIHFKDKAWFPIKEHSIKRATNLYQKWGIWTLLFAWLPIIGDPFTLVAGIFRTRFLLFLLLVTIGKASRYIALVSVF